ncbi:BlaI/MecI/CopY family transcriptional regulator [bacterium]|nr:BlaI/MecI/CopY family transcriptional regulator [bacterium]
MASRKHHVTDAELAVLQYLWDNGAASTRDICNQLYPQNTVSQYYTVQKLLDRLETRGCVTRDRSERVHRFSAAIDRDVLLAERLQDLSESLCDGSLMPLLSGLLKLKRWTTDEQQQLQQLIDELMPKKRKQ